jgi:hypothetical protein
MRISREQMIKYGAYFTRSFGAEVERVAASVGIYVGPNMANEGLIWKSRGPLKHADLVA